MNLKSWLSVNSMIVGWICTSTEPRVQSTVTFITDAHKLWENLKQRFEVGNKVRVHQLMEQLVSCRENGQSVINYYGKLGKIVRRDENIQTFTTLYLCSSSNLWERREDERVHQFIMEQYLGSPLWWIVKFTTLFITN